MIVHAPENNWNLQLIEMIPQMLTIIPAMSD